MIPNARTSVAMFIVTLMATGLFISPEKVSARTVSGPVIDDIIIELENRTGDLHFLFEAEGRAPPGTDHVNVSFGYENSTTREELDYWIEPVDTDLFLAGIYLEGEGPAEDPWTVWRFSVWADIPMDDIGSTLDLLEPLLGFAGYGRLEGNGELEEFFDLEELLNISDIGDLEETIDEEMIMEVLLETSILFIARAYSEDGNYSEGEKDIKFDLMNAAFSFLIEEGIVDDPAPETDDDNEDSDRSDGSGNEKDEGVIVARIAIVAIGAGILLLLLVGVILLLTLNSRKKS